MASSIDTRMKQLDALGLDEVDILAAMADYMAGFSPLMTNMTGPAMNALCRELVWFLPVRQDCGDTCIRCSRRARRHALF